MSRALTDISTGSEGSMPAQDVRKELERLLADPDFDASPTRRKMLTFVVEETLSARSNRLKGAVIAQDVFGRGADFDPQTDPVVRIEARRLRRDLGNYYAHFSDRAAIRFDIPKGAYAVVFSWISVDQPDGDIEHSNTSDPAPTAAAVSTPTTGKHQKRRYPAWSVAGVLLLILVAVLGWYAKNNIAANAVERTMVDPPGIAVGAFVASGLTQQDGFLAHALEDQLAHDLMLFDWLTVFRLPENDAAATASDYNALKQNYGILYIVSGSLSAEPAGGQVHLVVQLSDTNGRVVWSKEFGRPRSASALISLQKELSSTIATELAQTYGIVAADLRAKTEPLMIPSDTTFACLLQAYEYRRNFAPALRDSTENCLAMAVERDPQSADAQAMLGWVELYAYLFGNLDAAQKSAHLGAALAATERAIDLEPENTLALQAYSSVLHHSGAYDKAADVIRRAHELRPNDPDILQQMGWRLAIRGNIDEGSDYIRAAIKRSIDPPRRYYNFIAIDDYLDGRYSDMLRAARLTAEDGRPVGNALLAIASAKAPEGSMEEAAAALARMAKADPGFAADPGATFRRHGATDDIVDALVSGLTDAGWVAPARDR